MRLSWGIGYTSLLPHLVVGMDSNSSSVGFTSSFLSSVLRPMVYFGMLAGILRRESNANMLPSMVPASVLERQRSLPLDLVHN